MNDVSKQVAFFAAVIVFVLEKVAKHHEFKGHKGAFNNYVDRFLPFFDPPPLRENFYTLSVDKNRNFLNLSSLILSTR